jgi:hypothetical protein
MSDDERFWSRVQGRGTAGCWIWTGPLTNGYGYFHVEGKSARAHRWAYQVLVGPIPDGLVIDHLCRVRNCVNPAHMEPVTHAENTRRGLVAIPGRPDHPMRRITHCPQRHPYDEANTILIVRGPYSVRKCRECKRAEGRASHHRNRQRRLAAMTPGGLALNAA